MKKAFKLNLSCDDHDVDWIECDTFIVENNAANLLNISDNEYIPTKGDKFYFLPGISIPRVKLKDLTRDYGIKSTRSLQNATHIFAGKSTENKVSDSVWLYKIPTDAIQKLYDLLKEADYLDNYYLNKLETALLYNENEYVFVDYSTAGIFRNNTHEIFDKLREDEHVRTSLRSSKYICKIDSDYIDDLIEIEKLNIPILDESKLLKHINGEDATTIDEGIYQQLKTMYSSSDADNHILAMEIMANSNYIDSLMYIEMLFKEHHHQMESSRSRNHVNFKGLLAFLGKSRGDMATTLDDIITSLRDNGVLTIDKLNYLLQKYSAEIQCYGDTEIFKVKTVTINEDLLKELDHNYKYELVSDYIPEAVIENNTNEDVTDPLDVNEDTEEKIEVNNNSGDLLETNEKENDNGKNFDWF